MDIIGKKTAEKLVFGIYQAPNQPPRLECNVAYDFAIRMLAAVMEDLREKRALEMFADMLDRVSTQK